MRRWILFAMAAVAVLAWCGAVAATAWAWTVFAEQRGPDWWRFDISTSCFEPALAPLFDTWLGICGACVAMLMVLRFVQLAAEYRDGGRPMALALSVVALALGLCAVPFLVLMCPVYYWVGIHAHFLFAVVAIGLAYTYIGLQACLYGIMVRRTRAAPRKPRALSLLVIVAMTASLVGGLVCIVVWVISELQHKHISVLEWTGVGIIFLGMTPIALELLVFPCVGRGETHMAINDENQSLLKY